MRRVPLSVLELSPVGSGQTSRDALLASAQLAGRAEQLGYARFWVAEHHNTPSVASTSPAVLLAHLAAATERIRLGSGGVMLPNHAPLVVAEQFAILEALHPGRVDLGIGRAPGTDPVTAAALRRTPEGLGAEDFPQELDTLLALLGDPTRAEPRQTRLSATPAATSSPQVCLLGSSGYSAQVAAALGLPFAFAHHFSAQNTEPALALYRDAFTPSRALQQPHAMVVASALAAPTAAEAERLALPGRLMLLQLRTGRPGPIATPEEAAAYPWTDAERDLLARWPSQPVVGTAEHVVDELDALVDRTGADELMLATSAHSAEDRARSLELIAQAWARPVPAGAA
ncbi:LLM class flavin-dependent oxidoreductase [Motilibacter sp. K478]|nr:LLM class flavin-dependent oxidoreductase [Motilibacter aurantiacus]